MAIKKGDTVQVLTGKNRGKKGKVIRVLPERGKVIVEGVNIAKRHQRPSRNFQGGIIEKAMPLQASNVMLVCPRCSEPTRISYKTTSEKKVRVCQSCDEIMDKV